MTDRRKPEPSPLDPITYRVRITLSRAQWERLERECQERHVTGRVLITSAIADLARYLLHQPTDPPPPEYPPDDEPPADEPPSAMGKLFSRRPTPTTIPTVQGGVRR